MTPRLSRSSSDGVTHPPGPLALTYTLPPLTPTSRAVVAIFCRRVDRDALPDASLIHYAVLRRAGDAPPLPPLPPGK